MKFSLIVKDVFQTSFMQSADVFEKFKFVGRIASLEAHGPKYPRELPALSLQDFFDKCRKNSTNEFEVVGIVVPSVGAMFVPNHTVYSSYDGRGWLTVDKLVKTLGCDSYQIST